MINFLDKWHKTRPGYFVLGLFELGFAYIFIMWALDTGSMFDYLFTLLFIFGALQNFVKLIQTYNHGKRTKS